MRLPVHEFARFDCHLRDVCIAGLVNGKAAVIMQEKEDPEVWELMTPQVARDRGTALLAAADEAEHRASEEMTS